MSLMRGIQVKDDHSIFRMLALLIFGSEDYHHLTRALLGNQLSTYRGFYLKTLLDDQKSKFHDFYNQILRGEACGLAVLQLCADLFQIAIRAINVSHVAVNEFLPATLTELRTSKKINNCCPARIVWLLFDSREIFEVNPPQKILAEKLAALSEAVQRDTSYDKEAIATFCHNFFSKEGCKVVSLNDDERLYSRLNEMEFEMHEIAGGGNCLFRALSDQVFRDEERHLLMRRLVTAWFTLTSASGRSEWNPVKEVGVLGRKETWEEYKERMARVGVWGDEYCIQTAADMFCSKIIVIYSGDCFMQDFYPYDSEAYVGPIFLCSTPKHMDSVRRKRAAVTGSFNL